MNVRDLAFRLTAELFDQLHAEIEQKRPQFLQRLLDAVAGEPAKGVAPKCLKDAAAELDLSPRTIVRYGLRWGVATKDHRGQWQVDVPGYRQAAAAADHLGNMPNVPSEMPNVPSDKSATGRQFASHGKTNSAHQPKQPMGRTDPDRS